MTLHSTEPKNALCRRSITQTIATVVLCSLVALGSSLHAEVLYKWKEADGSLTFSPKPPPAGSKIQFEKVNAPVAKDVSTISKAVEPDASSASIPEVTQNLQQNTQQAVPASMPSVATTQPLTTDQNVSGIAPDKNLAALNSETPDEKIPTRDPSHAQLKSAQCNELRNRVLSLEGLLRTKIDPQTMDNAVVQMAKYQKNINKSCQ